MNQTPQFATPPIVELVIGAQFSPLTKLTSGHFGKYWERLGADWIEPSDSSPIDEEFETFDRPERMRSLGIEMLLKPLKMPGLFRIGHRSQDRMIQVQATRFHLNWRKSQGFYPSYKNLIAEFEAEYQQFQSFIEEMGIGQLALNQWELTYIDSFPKNEYWKEPNEWQTILPGLFGSLLDTRGMGVSLEHRAAAWSFEIEPKRGRLHVSANRGIVAHDPRDALLLQMTARGPIGREGVATLREGLDLGHDVAVKTFLRVVDQKIQTQWGQQS